MDKLMYVFCIYSQSNQSIFYNAKGDMDLNGGSNMPILTTTYSHVNFQKINDRLKFKSVPLEGFFFSL